MLRHRLSLLLALTLVSALAISVALSVALFSWHQSRELTALLRRELGRVTTLMAEPSVGASLLTTDYEHLRLQLVGPHGQVLVPIGAAEAIPLHEGWVTWGGRRVLVATAPLVLEGGQALGTVRLSYDGTEAAATRRALRTSLLVAAGTIALLGVTLGLGLLVRQLRPLAVLAERAAAMRPSDPELSLPPMRDDEVGRVAAALEQAVAAIRRRQREEREALAGVAHELAAPLTVVAGQLEALAEADPSRRLLAARDAARELLYTSQDLLTLARAEIQVPFEGRAVSLADVAERVSAEYQGVRFERDGEGLVLGNAERLAQVVRNLVRNAVQAGGGAEGVRVRVSASADSVRLDVVDRGRGLDADSLEHLFERGYTQRAGRGGSGIGLSVVKGLVEAHGGTVMGAPEPGGGARFVVELPSLTAEFGI